MTPFEEEEQSQEGWHLFEGVMHVTVLRNSQTGLREGLDP